MLCWASIKVSGAEISLPLGRRYASNFHNVAPIKYLLPSWSPPLVNVIWCPEVLKCWLKINRTWKSNLQFKYKNFQIVLFCHFSHCLVFQLWGRINKKMSTRTPIKIWLCQTLVYFQLKTKAYFQKNWIKRLLPSSPPFS